jgi:hypothetical protein
MLMTSSHTIPPAWKDERETHVAGAPGTPLSLCVSSGAKLLKTQHGES